MNTVRRLWSLLPMITALAAQAAEPRTRELFDFDWKFIAQDVAGAHGPECDDRAWQAVDLPHDFQIHGPFDEKAPGGFPNGFRPLGVGWYRKTFATPPGLEGRRVRLEFEGVYRAPKVWLNGVLIADHPNGYTGFARDVTAQLKPAGQPNVLAVRADNSLSDTSRWYTGAGIYRHVWLTTVGEVHVPQDGTYVTTPKITTGEAWVNAQTELRNESAALRWATLASEILDPDGRSVAQAKAVVPVRAGETMTVRQQLTVPTPRLWDLATPVLYRLVSRVSVDGRESDRYETPFGIREIRMTGDGLFLNGRRVFLKGFCVHHDHGCLGAAAFDRAIERRLLTMKEMGCNAIRLAHNPHATSLLDLCDRLGLLVYDEAFDIRNRQFYGTEELFAKLWAEDLRWFVRRDRNHPSVFIWSVGNEGKDIFQAPDYGVTQSAKMADLVRALEPTRPVTQALYPMRWDAHRQRTADKFPDWENDPPHQVTFHMDVMSANYMEKWFAQDRVRFPQLAFISSESNTGANGRSAWRSLDRAHAVGIFYWGGIPYLGESHKWPIKSWHAGFLDLCGFRRPGSWDVQSFFSDRPMVRLAIDRPEAVRIWNDVRISHSNLLAHWNFAPGAKLTVEAYTNAEEVELLLDGRSLGTRRRDGEPGVASRLVWDVPFAAGTLSAVARNNGEEVARDALRTAGPAAALRLTADQTTLKADGQDLAHLMVEVVDAAGVLVPDAAHLVTFAVTGPGTNAGVDNGDPASDELFQANRRSVYQGRALLVVRTRREPGAITVQASAAGLAPATVQLVSARGR
jgi:beta-galactosidase